MPSVVSEITTGYQYSQTQGSGGTSQDTATRSFRVILSYPGEIVDPQIACGVTVGSAHPAYSGLKCISADVRYEGDSRMALLCTFQYQGDGDQQTPGQGDPPGTEKATWTLSSSLIEAPVYTWRRRTQPVVWEPEPKPAVNSAGDIYDAITQLTGVVNITITQDQIGADPIKHIQHCGSVNLEVIELETLTMNEHTVMFRGLDAQPVTRRWNGQDYRVWQCKYEFLYKPNRTKIMLESGVQLIVDLGWDIAVPQSGFNVKAFTPAGASAIQDQFGQPLLHTGGMIDIDNGIGLLPEGVAPGDKMRAMVRVFSYEGNGVSQAPSASPIPLNDDGTPRKETADPKVLVYGYSVQPDLNFTETFGLRLY